MKLFAPAITALLFAAFFTFLDFSGIWISDKYLAIPAFIIGIWGAIQVLFYSNRPYKDRYRLWLILCILVYPPFFVQFFLGDKNPSEAWSIPLSLAVFIATILFFLRHHKNVFTLAPGWYDMKKFTTIGALAGMVLWVFMIVDNLYTHLLDVGYIINQTLTLTAVFIWLFIAGLACLCYYVEAILHHIRNDAESWDKRLDEIGEDGK